MALVMELRCSGCGYQRRAADSVLLVEVAADVYEPCSHPLEDYCAQQLTGLDLTELRRQGRLYGGCPAFCPRCGEVGDHRRTSESQRYGESWAKSLICRSCGAHGLHPFELPHGAPPGGFLTAMLLFVVDLWLLVLGKPWAALIGAVLFAAFIVWWCYGSRRARQRQAQVPCPQCGERKLSTKSWGVS